MAHIVTDRVLETTTTTGTGAITLAGAVTQFQDFDSQMANADTTAYWIKGISGSATTEWEVGLGTWNTGNTLSRTTVVRSSNSNAAVNFSSGTKLIGMTFTPTVRQPGMSFTGALTPATNDLAALGSASLSWADLFLASGAVINVGNGEVTLTFSANDLAIAGGSLSLPTAGFLQFGSNAFSITETSGTGILNGGLVLDSGTTSVAPMNIPNGTLKTTPTLGDFEADATNWYGTTDAGNRGYMKLVHAIRLNGTRTFTSNTNAQNIFTDPANGRLTIETGVYDWDALLSVGSMSGTSGNLGFNVLGGGSATLTQHLWMPIGVDASTATATAAGGSHNILAGQAAPISTAAVGTSFVARIEGTFKCTGAGTIQPQITLQTAAAATLTAGSRFRIWRWGDTNRVSVGQWD